MADTFIQQVKLATTVGSNQVRLRLPPKAARTVGPPNGADAPMNRLREAHRSAWPLHCPEGGMTSSDPASRQRGGTRVAGVGTRVGTRVPTSVGSRALAMAVLDWDRQGWGACQRSSMRRRRVHLLATDRGRRPAAGRVPVKRDRGRRPNSPAGWCGLRRPPDPAADEPCRPIALDSGAAVPQLRHRSPGEHGGQQAGGRHPTVHRCQACSVRPSLRPR
jgi:hypothetical protein